MRRTPSTHCCPQVVALAGVLMALGSLLWSVGCEKEPAAGPTAGEAEKANGEGAAAEVPSGTRGPVYARESAGNEDAGADFGVTPAVSTSEPSGGEIVAVGSSDSGSAAVEEATSRGVVGVSLLTLTNPFFKVIGDTITAEAAQRGYSTIVVSGDRDVATQEKQVQDFIVRGCSAIVLSPCDSKSIGPVIQRANEAGIPVFTVDIKSLAPEADVVCHVATDNLGGGREAGRAMIEALGEAGGKVVVIDFKQAESCLLRVQGFKEVISAHNEKAENRIVIAAELPGGGVKDEGYKAAEDALQAHPDMVGIFAINDPSALGARAALEKAGKADQIKIIGFDGQPDGKQAIKEGKIWADPIQFPDRMGVKIVEVMELYFEGEEVEPEILIPTALYRQSDAQNDPSLR